MICLTHRIEYDYGQTISIIPFFDVHYLNQACDINAFKRDLEEDPNSYILGGGDWMDLIITQDLRRYRKTADAAESEAIVDESVDGMYQILTPHRDRIIGLGSGNHEDAIARKCGTHPMRRLCNMLDVPFLGFSWFIKLILSRDGGGGRTVMIKGHHGWGGGSRTQGADLTKFCRDIQSFDADIFLFGHVHRKQADRVPRLGMVGNKLISKPILLGICGTYLKTYTETEEPTYSEIKGYPPTEIGHLTVNIRPTENHLKMWIDS